MPCDVRSAESVTHLFDTVIQTFGRVDALVNNAGIGFVMKHTRDVAPQEWQLVIDVTLSGVFLCTQAAAQHMEAADAVAALSISPVRRRNRDFRIWRRIARRSMGSLA